LVLHLFASKKKEIIVNFLEKYPNILEPNFMLKCHCFYLALQSNLHQHPNSSLHAPQGQ